MWLEVERPELVEADHHVRITATPFRLPIGKVVEVKDPVLLLLEVRIVAHLERLDHLKRDAFLVEQDP